MTQKVNKGLWLGQTQRGKSNWLLSSAGTLAACVVLLLTVFELSGFHRIYAPWAMAVSGGSLCAAHSLLKLSRRQNLFYPTVLFALVLTVIFFRETFQNGIGLFWNQLGNTLTAATGWMMPQWQTEPNRGLLLVSLVAGGISALVCCALGSCAQPVLTAVLPSVLLAGMLYFRKTENVGSLLPVLLTTVFLLLCSHRGSKYIGRSMLIGWTAAGVLIIGLLTVSLTPQISDWAKNYSLRLQKDIHSRIYETDYTVLPEGDFSSFVSQEDTGHPALAVTMETPETLYLRGFTGATFEADTWSSMDSEILAENKDLLYWLNLNEFHVQTQFEAAAKSLETKTNTIMVQNIGACSRYRYIPFNLRGSIQPEVLSPDSLLCDAERVYQITVVEDGANRIEEVMEVLQNSEDAAVLRYRKAESAYRDFVYENYMQIPQEVLSMLQAEWDVYAASGKWTSQQAQASARTFLQACFPEDGSQTMDLPLSQAAGSSYQYATVAVLTLRYFGIPARYAEGYLITEEAANSAEGEAIQVDSSCAGAWAEVYQDGIGWIPMDLTKSFVQSEGTQNGNQNNTGKRPAQETLKEGEELEETPENAVQEPEPKGGSIVRVAKTIRWGLFVLVAVFLLLSGFVMLRRRYILTIRKRLFEDKNNKTAVAIIYAHCTVLLKQLGFDRGNGSMKKLGKPIEDDLGEDYGTAFYRMTELNALALFSSRPIDDSQKAAMVAFYETTLQCLKQHTKWPMRLWQQWIRCLY